VVSAEREAPGEPDVEIGAAASAKKLRFRKKPKVEVKTHAEHELDPQVRDELERVEAESGSHTERENLPDEVEPGVTYRDVRVRWRAGARLRLRRKR
jgi:hypothetical protein